MFSSRNWIVLQLIRSVSREVALCTRGDLCPSSSPQATTAMTPDACASSAGR